MIRFADGEELLSQLRLACRLEPVLGGKLDTLLAVYGAGSPLCEFWVMMGEDDTPVGAMGREGGTITLALSQETDLEELAQFLPFVGGSLVEGREPWLSRLAQSLGASWESYPVLRLTGELPPKEPASPVTSLTQVYRMLCRAQEGFEAHAPYDSWLWGFSARARLERAAAFGVFLGEELVSASSVYYQGQGIGMIGSVATLPSQRGQGFAARTVASAAQWIEQRGNQPILLAADRGLVDFYKKLGFTPWGEAGQIVL